MCRALLPRRAYGKVVIVRENPAGLHRIRLYRRHEFKNIHAYLGGQTIDELHSSAKAIIRHYFPGWFLVSFRQAHGHTGFKLPDPWGLHYFKWIGLDQFGESPGLKETAIACILERRPHGYYPGAYTVHTLWE